MATARWKLSIGALLFATACSGAMYRLPAPPPPQKRGSVSLIPGEEQRKAEEHYLQARAAVIKLNTLLSTKRFAEASELMSLETRDWLLSMGAGAEVPEILASGKLQLPDGKVVDFKPVPTLLAEDVSRLTNTIDGVEEHETDTRIEIFATLPSGMIQKIVLIAEGGQWVLHRTRLPEPFEPPPKDS